MFNKEILMEILGEMHETNFVYLYASPEKYIKAKKDKITLKGQYVLVSEGASKKYLPYGKIMCITVGPDKEKNRIKNKPHTTFSRIKQEPKKMDSKNSIEESTGSFATPRGANNKEEADWDMNERLQF